MDSSLGRTILVLDANGEQLAAADATGTSFINAFSPLEAAKSLAAWRPQVWVLRSDCSWQRALARSLPPEVRPGILDVAASAWPEADDWVHPERLKSEGVLRLRRAAERGRARRAAARGATTDPLTGLPNLRRLASADVPLGTSPAYVIESERSAARARAEQSVLRIHATPTSKEDNHDLGMQ